ncbi:NAF1-domain-containing protein [Trichoderma citrinoviride]|uniref:H/ACA ribonucleoprotein complex non-core subunit NAF1 n=1 Tax=Trichoderma citrinoviride TaxID=58853 RepID=A0A2T4BCA3_9HYPO|nr:NAF1-domain-containing protein [Trichoderma citrinoviride]PTB66908.1 NAF1-domain-containing protein [Trichoderma citrinoviride]
MSGFQIPGLGQAKPNEVLPPLPADLAVAAASAAEDDREMLDVNHSAPQTAPSTTEGHSEPVKAVSEAPADHNMSDSMPIGQPGSPPSVTHALEAALGGLDNGETPQQAPQPDAEPVPLQPDESENPEWEIDSSPYESSDSSSSDSSSEDDDSDNEGYEPLGIEETARLLMEMEGGSDDEGDKGKSAAGYVRTKNELPEEPIPRPDVTITPEMKIEELGVVEQLVENIMLVKAFTPGEYQVLDSGSVLCNSERVVIGVVGETIGKVVQPMYTVTFNSAEEVKELGLEVGTKIFYPVDHASYVFTEPLKNLKGSDASNLHDEEIGDEEVEFSDDEKEAEYKRSLKQKKKDKWKSGGKEGKQAHPLRQEMSADGSLNYDEDDGPYKPLARPAGYGTGPQSTESHEPPPRSSFPRGGRRGDSRGRGGRGRGAGRGGRGGYNQPRDGYSLPPQGAQNPSASAPPSGSWNFNPVPPPNSVPAPSLPQFGFPLPGWQQPVPSGVPPPPPGWPGSAQGQGQASNAGNFVNPAFFAALMSQIQAQSGQTGWNGQVPPPPPPPQQ